MLDSPSRLAVPIGLITLAAYLALVPWTGRVWLRTGDEPHYLIAAHSIAYDGDLDLQNNYDPNVYLSWYSAPNLSKQVRVRADGAEFLAHTYGLPILLAPIYRVAGAVGVPYFLAGLGALLGANVYLLAYQVTSNWKASGLAWLAVAFSPPLVWYVGLVYPELAGALCVTLAVRVLLKERPWQCMDVLMFGLPTAALPWLSARFIPAALTLGALALWRVGNWRSPLARWALGFLPQNRGPHQISTIQANDRDEGFCRARFQSRATAVAVPLISLIGFTVLNHWLYGNPQPTASYAGTIPTPGASWLTLLQFLRGVLGWLMDQQRGLLVTAPIYIVILIGVGQWLWKSPDGAVVAAAPFATALASISFLGGFWIGVEPAARYLVYTLPPLGAGLAYAWTRRRGPWFAGALLPALLVSAWASIVVIQEPELAQTEDLIGDKAPGLAAFLPSMARTLFLEPGGDDTVAGPLKSTAGVGDGGPLWRVATGTAGVAMRHEHIRDFSFGWYQIRLPMAAVGADADAPVARLSIHDNDDRVLFERLLHGRDFPADGGLRTFTFQFHNPVYNQWEKPSGMWIFAIGTAELTLGRVTIVPQPFHSLALPGIWLAGWLLLGGVVGRQHNPSGKIAVEPRGLSSWPIYLVLVAAVLSVGWWSLQPQPRRFGVRDLRHFVGALVSDPEASTGEAVAFRPELGEEAGVLASTRAQFFSPGRYAWRLRLKAGEAMPQFAVAKARVLAARQPVTNEAVDIGIETLPADGNYHMVEARFHNPVEQALVFSLNTTGAAQLRIDWFEVVPAD